MGKTKDQKKKIVKLIAQLESLVCENDQRLTDFRLELEHALNESKKEKRIYRLSRLRDEMHGYYIRIYQNILSANKTQSRLDPKKDFNNLDQYIEEHQQIVETLNNMELPRNKSAHPDPYYLNFHTITSNEEVLIAVKSVKNALIKTANIQEFDIKREQNSQKDFLEQNFEKIIEFTTSDIPNEKFKI